MTIENKDRPRDLTETQKKLLEKLEELTQESFPTLPPEAIQQVFAVFLKNMESDNSPLKPAEEEGIPDWITELRMSISDKEFNIQITVPEREDFEKTLRVIKEKMKDNNIIGVDVNGLSSHDVLNEEDQDQKQLMMQEIENALINHLNDLGNERDVYDYEELGANLSRHFDHITGLLVQIKETSGKLPLIAIYNIGTDSDQYTTSFFHTFSPQIKEHGKDIGTVWIRIVPAGETVSVTGKKIIIKE